MLAAIVWAEGIASACITSNFAALTSNPIGLRVELRGLDARGIEVERDARREAALRRCDREHARPAAEIEHRTLGLELEQELQAELRGLMGPGTEGHPGIDHEIGHARLRLEPRRPHVQLAADRDRLVEVAPPLVPVVGDLLGEHVDRDASDVRRRSTEIGQLAGRAIDGVFDELGVLGHIALLDAGGRELDELGEDEFGLIARNAHGQADHLRLPARRRRRSLKPPGALMLWS